MTGTENMRTFSVCMILGVLVLVQRIYLGIASFSKSTIYLRKFTLPDGDRFRSFSSLYIHTRSSTECAVLVYQLEVNYFAFNEKTSTCIFEYDGTFPGYRPGCTNFVSKGNGINLFLEYNKLM